MFGLGLWSLIVLATGVGSIVALLLYMGTGHGVRYDEDRAREYFDTHGHWPDQTAEDLAAEREAAQAYVQATTSQADADGLV